jgi:hypothetical protein
MCICFSFTQGPTWYRVPTGSPVIAVLDRELAYSRRVRSIEFLCRICSGTPWQTFPFRELMLSVPARVSDITSFFSCPRELGVHGCQKLHARGVALQPRGDGVVMDR